MVDLPANATTPARVTVGGSYAGLIETGNDKDWIAVTLTAGSVVRFTLNASGATPLSDPVLALYGAAGGLLGENDDGPVGLNAALTHTVLTTGTYYIQAGAYGSADTGGYTVGVTLVSPPPPPPPPPQNLLDTINWGTTLADPVVTVYFAPAGQSFDGYTSEGFNAFEIARFQAAFALIAAVSGLTFSIVNTAAAADFDLVLDTNQNNGEFLGYFNPPGTTNAGVGVFSGNQWDRTAGGDLQAGGYGMVTIVHEVLHGLGLAHPHDDGGTSTIMNGVTATDGDYGDFNLNQGLFTTMSYNTGYATGTPGSGVDPNGNFGHEYGPMALDIALLQQKYGTNAATNAGNTVYMLRAANAAGTFWQAIWDAGGTDEIRHTGTASSVIDLRSATLVGNAGGGGFVSAVNGIAGGYTIAAAAVIENASGGSGRDVITGNAAGNRLSGGAGNDVLDGLSGVDRLEGEAGNDILVGGAGADALLGGSESDTADYSGSLLSVTVRLSIGTGLNGDAAGDTLSGIENLTGSAFGDGLAGADIVANRLRGGAGNDYLSGLSGADRLEGEAGNDILVGGTGADVLIGGTNVDTADYSGSALGVTVRLYNGTGLNGDAAGDALSGIENLTGSGAGDGLVGSDGVANTLRGGAGNDYLDGRSGADRLDGGAGNDTLVGGADGDHFAFASGYGQDRVTAFQDGIDRVDLVGLSFAQLTETAIGGGVRLAITAAPATFIELLGVTTAQVTAGDFI